MKYTTIYLAFLFCIVGSLAGCSTQNPIVVTEPGDYSQALAPINPKNVLQTREINILSVNSDSVIFAAYYPEKNAVLALYSKSGFLREWDVANNTITSEFNLKITSGIGIPFDNSGATVIGAIYEKEEENDYGILEKSFSGIGVWDTESGEQIACISHPCDGDSDSRIDYGYAVLDPRGGWVIDYTGTVIRIIDLSRTYGSEIKSIGQTGEPRYAGKLVIDPVNQRFAVGFIQGDILLEEFNNTSLFKTSNWLGDYSRYTPTNVTALAFSPDGNLLGRIQDKTLTVWDLDLKNKDKILEINCVDCSLMTFDWYSQLLFIGKSDRIEIYELNEGELVGILDSPHLTSISLSSDNRILVWGDLLGDIHVLGIPQSNLEETSP